MQSILRSGEFVTIYDGLIARLQTFSRMLPINDEI